MMPSGKLFLFLVAAFTLVNCGTGSGGPVATVKATPSPDAQSFERFIYNEKPKPNEKFRYSETPDGHNLDLGSVNNDKKHSLAGYFLLTLLRKGEFHLFYYEYMYYTKTDGSFCRGSSGEVNFRRVNKLEMKGKWARDKKIVTLSDIGTLAPTPGAGMAQATLQLDGAAVPADVSKKSTVLAPVTDAKDLAAWQAEQSQPKLTIKEAVTQLDSECGGQETAATHQSK